MYTDRKGIWVGTLYGGLNYQSRSAENLRFIFRMIIRRVQSQWIHGLYWDEETQKLWVGTEDEAVRFSIRICLFLLRSRILLLRSPVSEIDEYLDRIF